jgi:hypothetical protein
VADSTKRVSACNWLQSGWDKRSLSFLSASSLPSPPPATSNPFAPLSCTKQRAEHKKKKGPSYGRSSSAAKTKKKKKIDMHERKENVGGGEWVTLPTVFS